MAGNEKLTATFLRTVKKSGKFADGKGLYLEVTGKNGSAKSWVLRYSRKKLGDPRPGHMGLGSAYDFGLNEEGLEQVREEARYWRRQLKLGNDPLKMRKAERARQQQEANKNVTFAFAAKDWLDHTSHTLSSVRQVKLVQFRIERHLIGFSLGDDPSSTKERWRLNPPPPGSRLGNMPIADIDHTHMEKVLTLGGLWYKKPATAEFTRWYAQAIFDRATAKGWRTGDNPALMKGPLGTLLHPVSKFHQEGPMSALPFQQIGAFMAALRAYVSEKGWSSPMKELLETIILTGVRFGQARQMKWSNIDENHPTGPLWTCPAEDTKSGKKTKQAHLIPLTERVMEILRAMKDRRKEDGIKTDFVFVHGGPKRDIRRTTASLSSTKPWKAMGISRRAWYRRAADQPDGTGVKPWKAMGISRDTWLRRAAQTDGHRHYVGRPLSNEGALACLRRVAGKDFVGTEGKSLDIHGFRSTFSSWAYENGYNEIDIEWALHHHTGNQIARKYNYQAARLLDRRKLLEAWGRQCNRSEPLPAGVISFQTKRKQRHAENVA